MATRGPLPFPTSEYAYDIFLSFRGEDTRKIFTTRLYSALVQAGFGAFIDDNGIERGEDIKSELTRAIHHSRGSIVVLSKNYANSSWCLDELVMIVEERKSKGHAILPIFYYVSPSDVGNQMGSFAAAFDKHKKRVLGVIDEQKRTDLMKKIEKWRDALTDVAALGGMILRSEDCSDEYESTFIEKTIEVIEDKLKRAVLTGAHKFVGISSRVKDISDWLKDKSSQVGILVICGIGGIGKTTIAKFVYNQNSELFSISSFIANVREIYAQPDGLVRLQRKLLSDILGVDQKELHGVDDESVRIKTVISKRRVLLVLDDVDQGDELDPILGLRDWFHPGSKIIITTQNPSLLKPNEVYKVHSIEPLDCDESLQLFSWYAFGQQYPHHIFMDLSEWVVNRCNGLPLALMVLGSALFGKSLTVWESMLRKLKEFSPNQIRKFLEISYESLADDHDKKLFLHIACFFLGQDKDYIVKILDECGFHTLVGIQNLVDRCLLTIDLNKLRMHQSIRDMGREVVRKESKWPERRSRLWHYRDSLNVLKFKTGTEAIEGLILDMRFGLRDNFTRTDQYELDNHYLSSYSWDSVVASSMSIEHNLETDAFKEMQNLKLLRLDYVNISGSFDDFPKTLKWFSWHGFPLKFVPKNFPLNNLTALDMSNSRLIRFWKQSKIVRFLKILNLSHSPMLQTTPDFSGFLNLESVILKGCKSLTSIHKSIGYIKRLVYLDLEDCRSLTKLPKKIVLLERLETLIVSGCTNIKRLPTEMNKLGSLKVLKADGITQNILLLSEEVTNISSRLWPWASKPKKVANISWSSLPMSLVSLSLSGCNLTEEKFPKDIGSLISLKELDLSRNPLRTLPQFVDQLSELKILQLVKCTKLRSLLGLPDVRILGVSDCKSLKTITHTSASFKLQNISYNNCDSLKEIQGLFSLEPLGQGNFEMLQNLGLFGSESLSGVEVNFQDGITFSTKKCPVQVLYEFGIFSTSIPGTEIPNWFGYKIAGSVISFTVPSMSDLEIRGLNICFRYGLCASDNDEIWFPEYILFIKITNKTKDLKWIYYPTCFGIPEADTDLVWLSHWTFRNQLEKGDEVEISIITGDNFELKECGINFCCHEPEENTQSNYLSWREVIGGNLTAFQLSSGEYYLCRSGFLRVYEEEEVTRPDDWTNTSWGRRLFGGPIDFKEIRHMSWMGRHVDGSKGQ